MSRTSTPTPSFPLVGKSIDAGCLRLVQGLGCGGFGHVYRALDLSNSNAGNQFAVKVVAKRISKAKREAQYRELDIHARVSEHPNIVTIHRAFSDDNHLYLVFDLCLGGDLFSAITEKGLYFYNDDLTKKAFGQIVSAVMFCHSQGIYHRDLKPENILCSHDGSRVYLTDFGLATDKSKSSMFGIGSSLYMSPECIRQDLKLDSYSPRHTDIWALGMILINMITGRNPWREAVCSDDCFAAYLQDSNFLWSMLPLSKSACSLIRRILVMNPLDRILLEDLSVAIPAVDTFFMDDVELSQANQYVREVVQMGLKIALAPTPLRSTLEKPVCNAVLVRTHSSIDPEEEYMYPRSDLDNLSLDSLSPLASSWPVPPETVPSPYPRPNVPSPNTAPLAVPTASSSFGPITPETHPVPDMDVVIAGLADAIEDLALSSATEAVPKRHRNPSPEHNTLQEFQIRA